jgi:AcrR family transcriptional regulator
VRCIVEEGFPAATAKHVAERAGVTWGVIQYHFGDRDGLLMAVVDDGVSQLIKSLGETHVQRLPLRQRIEVVVDTAFRCYSSPTSLAAFEILRAMRGTHEESAQQHLMEIGKAVAQLGTLISADPSHAGVAEVIWAALRGMVLVEMIVNTHLEWQRERKLLVDMVTHYLQTGVDSSAD